MHVYSHAYLQFVNNALQIAASTLKLLDCHGCFKYLLIQSMDLPNKLNVMCEASWLKRQVKAAFQGSSNPTNVDKVAMQSRLTIR